VPLAAFVVMNHPDFSATAAKVNAMLSNIANPSEKSQLVVPTAISQILPVGVIGAFAAMMLFTTITQIDVFMLSWSSVLIQDVIIPLRGKKLEPKAHLLLLRLSVFIVAIITILISTFFKISDNIVMFMCLSGSIYTAGAGIVILGGLYWSRPTKLVAWITMLVGTILSLAGFIYRYKINTSFPLDGYDIGFGVSVICIMIYFALSLLIGKGKFNLNGMFKRGREFNGQEGMAFLNVFQWSRDMSIADKILFWFMISFTLGYLGVTAVIIILQLTIGLSVTFWLGFWKYYLYSMFCFGTLFLVWTTIGGFSDLRRMFKSLREETVNVNDDGTVNPATGKERAQEDVHYVP
jgi:SSS family solute:Na+ symporter